jgi:oxygen-independent coproporphyrinogen-3 oxidase
MKSQKYHNSLVKEVLKNSWFLSLHFMAGIYIHIPFCKQACYYCDFHFSTNQSYRTELVKSLKKELLMQKEYLEKESIETIYLGGGTPSILSINELEILFKTLRDEYSINNNAEITLEANPDDLTKEKILAFIDFGINRLSLGVQSFDDSVLKFLNRSHSANQVFGGVELLRNLGIKNINLDLIHSIPDLDESLLRNDLEQLFKLKPEHISAYSLTIEENTAFGKWSKHGKLKPLSESQSANQFELVMDSLIDHGYDHYEISNFSLPEFHSRHNKNYWLQKKYLGIGPGAHSFNGYSRQYNIANNHLYMKSINNGNIPFEIEILTPENKINEYIFTSLRTKEGCNLEVLTSIHMYNLKEQNSQYLNKILEEEYAKLSNDHIVLSRKGKLLADKIASDLFLLP